MAPRMATADFVVARWLRSACPLDSKRRSVSLRPACPIAFALKVRGWHFDLNRRGKSKQLLQPSRDLDPFFISFLGRATTALSYRCEQFC
jgi:hypothetical protein